MEEEKLDYEEETTTTQTETSTAEMKETTKMTKLQLTGLDMDTTTVDQVREALKETGFDGLVIINKPDMFEIECSNADELIDKLNNKELLGKTIKLDKWDQSTRKRSRTSSINSSSNVSQTTSTPSESKKRVKTVDERISKVFLKFLKKFNIFQRTRMKTRSKRRETHGDALIVLIGTSARLTG